MRKRHTNVGKMVIIIFIRDESGGVSNDGVKFPAPRRRQRNGRIKGARKNRKSTHKSGVETRKIYNKQVNGGMRLFTRTRKKKMRWDV